MCDGRCSAAQICSLRQIEPEPPLDSWEMCSFLCGLEDYAAHTMRSVRRLWELDLI